MKGVMGYGGMNNYTVKAALVASQDISQLTKGGIL
jgi:hypothetical protein